MHVTIDDATSSDDMRFEKTLLISKRNPTSPFETEVCYEGAIRVRCYVPYGLPPGPIEDLMAKSIANEMRKLVNSIEYERIVHDMIIEEEKDARR